VKHFLLLYTFADGYLERRPLFRESHLKYAWDAHDRGELLVAGALADPVDTGVLFFTTESRETVEEFARNDPYVLNGLVTAWRVRGWTTVVGATAASPVYPADVANSSKAGAKQ
jgi:uncharacterized protein YciI